MTVIPEPVIRTRKDHNISRRGIDPDALKVLYRLARFNHTAYLVGGGVRDLLLGRQPKDFDISTNARPGQIKKIFRNCFLIGRRFRLAHIKYGTKVIETSTFRGKPEQNGDDNSLFQADDDTFGSPGEDALRRDFTINGLFYDIENFSVIDYVGGLDDLDARKVRAIGDPDIRFREDPVRMIRAVRFASRLGFEIEENTFAAIIRHHEEIGKASPPRMLEEIYRLYAYSSGEAAFRLLKKTRLLEIMFPEILNYLEEGELTWKLLATLDSGDTVVPTPTPALMFAVLFYSPIMNIMEEAKKNDGNRKINDNIRDWLSPIAERFQFPRKVKDQLVRITTSQHRFDPDKRRRFSKTRFASHESFPEILALREINLIARGESTESLAEWRELLAEAEKKRKNDGTERCKSSGNKRRRRRSSRKQQAPVKTTETPSQPSGQPVKEEKTAAAKPSKKRRHRRSRKKPAETKDMPISATDFYLPEKKEQEAKPKADDKPKSKPEKPVESEKKKPAEKSFEQEEQAPHWLDEI